MHSLQQGHREFAEGEARDRPDGRPFLLCRSGGAGMQRFGAGTWTGDVNNTFSTLEAQIAMGLNVGMSGVPYSGTDVGGYYPTVEASAELFVRWFQFGAFCCPIFRAHGRAWRERLPWAYGSAIEDICRRYLELRYRPLPYTYTLARQAHPRVRSRFTRRRRHGGSRSKAVRCFRKVATPEGRPGGMMGSSCSFDSAADLLQSASIGEGEMADLNASPVLTPLLAC